MISANHSVWRLTAGLAVTAVVAGCSSIGGGDAASIYTALRQVWSGSKAVTLQEAASVPYASLGVRVGDSNQIMLILASEEGTKRLWTSASKIAIVTENGRIVRTAGMETNLEGSSRLTKSSDGSAAYVTWEADYPELGLYSVPISCRESNPIDETLEILGAQIRTRRIDEYCTSNAARLNWSFHNTFWFDPENGLVWRSIQHVHPRGDAITTETLRPPS